MKDAIEFVGLFPAAYEVETVDCPAERVDYVLGDPAYPYVDCFRITPREGEAYVVGIRTDDPGLSAALSVVLATPSPTQVCIIVRGQLYLGDVTSPETLTYQAAGRDLVLSYYASQDDGVLVLATDVILVAIDAHGLRWKTRQESVLGFNLTRIHGGILYGQVDTDLEATDFTLDLSNGRILEGGSRSLRVLRAMKDKGRRG
ncbi:MAG: hypothetical protein Q4C87_10780 [Actinomycetaceae bacterium]|nr:hypothetical protein [Actinomycetaceae bacterium]